MKKYISAKRSNDSLFMMKMLGYLKRTRPALDCIIKTQMLKVPFIHKKALV